jgi:hypothetical protein
VSSVWDCRWSRVSQNPKPKLVHFETIPKKNSSLGAVIPFDFLFLNVFAVLTLLREFTRLYQIYGILSYGSQLWTLFVTVLIYFCFIDYVNMSLGSTRRLVKISQQCSRSNADSKNTKIRRIESSATAWSLLLWGLLIFSAISGDYLQLINSII